MQEIPPLLSRKPQMMEPRHRLILIAVTIFMIRTSLQLPAASALTEPSDVTAILDLYASFDYPPQLREWRSDGGDPCEESWTGVACFESSIIYLKLNGLNLSGSLGGQLHNLYNLKQLDLSSNSITGGIPDTLPPNITRLNLASNHFSQSLPLSFSSLKNLRHLNLSNNFLTGAIGSAFAGLHDLRQMDLSRNNFTGDLPISFTNLENLSELFLQSNQFTGEVTFLANLPLTYLNIEDNQFSGLIPRNFQTIPNLWFGGNNFDGVGSLMWEFPVTNNSDVTNVSSPPTAQSSAMESSPTLKAYKKKKKLNRGVIACFAAGGTVVTICLLMLVTIHAHRVQPLIRTMILPSERSSLSGPPSARHHLIAEPLVISRLPSVKFDLEELRLATNGFSQEKVVDEGSLGSVYRANFPDGQVLAVKVMNVALASYTEEDEFFEVMRVAHRLRHPNIVSLVGYCMEQGQRILVYEYVKSLSLEVVLHKSRRFRPLSWSKRLQIAAEVASALDYLHYGLSPPVAHGNLKAENILLDEELTARISDCGLTVLRPRKSTSSKLMALRTVIEDSVGYKPNEYGVPDVDKCKMDVYAFGVLMLELLTGRRPFDSSRAMEERCVVKWAAPRLHDIELLEEMVDPTIRGTVSPRALSRFADIIALCVLPEQEYRPSISGLVESLEECARAAEEHGEVGRSFRSTNTALCGSPTLSNL